jgi:hypothetical protein
LCTSSRRALSNTCCDSQHADAKGSADRLQLLDWIFPDAKLTFLRLQQQLPQAHDTDMNFGLFAPKQSLYRRARFARVYSCEHQSVAVQQHPSIHQSAPRWVAVRPSQAKARCDLAQIQVDEVLALDLESPSQHVSRAASR